MSLLSYRQYRYEPQIKTIRFPLSARNQPSSKPSPKPTNTVSKQPVSKPLTPEERALAEQQLAERAWIRKERELNEMSERLANWLDGVGRR
jgi:hypothetical protein